MRSKYIIRGLPPGVTNPSESESGEIIARYANLDELVNAGWKLKD